MENRLDCLFTDILGKFLLMAISQSEIVYERKTSAAIFFGIENPFN